MKFTIDISEDFRSHLQAKASEKQIKHVGTYIKAVLKKVTKYKPKELV